MTGKSKNTIYHYLLASEVTDMSAVENTLKEAYYFLRAVKSNEIYFYNPELLDKYVKFIKSHSSFVDELFVKVEDRQQIAKIIKKTTPSLKERGLSQVDVMNKAKEIKNDEFYTRSEDVEKEVAMYAREIWTDKVVFCNCDDAVDEINGNINEKRTSAFALYFINNLKKLELKKLICTHYSGPVDLFNAGSKGLFYLITYEVGKDGEIKMDKQSPIGKRVQNSPR
jgi:hypothetical protein